MLDFYQLSPEEFECLCYEYICGLYGKEKNYQIKHTRYVHDGGRDIEITFYDQLSQFKIWAECKQHKRSIGLEDIGKNVVLVISKNIHKVIFFSASDITESAKIEIINIGNRLNFDVSFLCGQNLSNVIASRSDLMKKYFKTTDINNNLPCEKKVIVSCSVSEFESDSIIPINDQKRIYLCKGEVFNIYVRLSNQTNKPVREISIELLPSNNAIKIISAPKIKFEFLGHQGNIIAQFKGEIILKQCATIDFPKVAICYIHDETNKYEIISLPPLDISKCKKYPLVGKALTEFLAIKAAKAFERSDGNHPVFFDIRGISGSGKSRCASELQKKATEKGLNSIYLNASEYIDYDIIRKILCVLLHLPFYKGKINYSKEDVRKLIEIQGGSNKFSSVIANFIQKGIWGKNDLLYIIEALAYFFQNPRYEIGYCVAIDNTQALHPEILKVLIRLIEILSENQNKTILIFISNTERRAFSQRAFNSFLSFLDEKTNANNTTFISYTCSAFTTEDAKLLLMHLFEFQNQNDVLLNKLLQIIGRLPFEITMTLEFLADKNIIKWNNGKEWIINNYDKFYEFVMQGFPGSHVVLNNRIIAWKETHTKSMNIKFTDILSTVTAFDGFVPHAYLTDNNLDYELIEQLIDKLWLAPGGLGRGITFFHDNIKEHCKSLPQFKNNAKILRKVISWLNKNSDINVYGFEKIKFSCYYHLDMFDEAMEYGQNILCDPCRLSHTDIVEIGRTLYEDVRTRSNMEAFIQIAAVYASAVFSLDNKQLGSEVYQTIVDCIKNSRTAIDSVGLCQILHKAINSQLQSAKYENAIEWTGILEHIPDLPPKYRFIAENRYGVAYIALGQFDVAKIKLENSLDIALNEMRDPFWTSTAHSDIALYHFYNWKANGKEASAALIIDEFNLAVKDYEVCTEHNISRDLEMAWHKAFINIVKGEYDLAIAAADDCISQSRHNNRSYELSRGYYLLALAQLFKNDTRSAQSTLEEGLHACTLYGFPSGIFRIYNNLGVIYYSRNDFEKAKYYFDLALKTLDGQIEYKQYPVLTNLLLTSIRLNDNELTKRVQLRCDKINSNELFEYCKSIYNKTNIQQIDSFAFWGFCGTSYIF